VCTPDYCSLARREGVIDVLLSPDFNKFGQSLTFSPESHSVHHLASPQPEKIMDHSKPLTRA
jgi:hypothetical protein